MAREEKGEGDKTLMNIFGGNCFLPVAAISRRRPTVNSSTAVVAEQEVKVLVHH